MVRYNNKFLTKCTVASVLLIVVIVPQIAFATGPTKSDTESKLKSNADLPLVDPEIREKEVAYTDELKPKANTARQAREREQDQWDAQIRAGVQVVVTVILLGAALYVLLSKRYTGTEKHWAFGMVGTLVGFWFKG